MERQEHREKVLLSLCRLKVLNRDQVRVLIGQGKEWTNEILRDMVSDGLLVYREGGKGGRIYKLSKKGVEMMGEGTWVWGWGNLEHDLIRNWVIVDYLRRVGMEDVFVEHEIKGFGVVPDATIYERERGRYVFVEVDRFQKWKENVKKVSRYGLLKEHGVEFILLFVTEVYSRVERIGNLCDDAGIICEVRFEKG